MELIDNTNIFVGIDKFSVAQDILYDSMHILLEGIGPKEIQLFINFITEKYLSRMELSFLMKNFKYSNKISKSDYPLLYETNTKYISKSGSNIIFLLHLPLILEDIIPKDDSNLECFVKLAKIMQPCISPCLHKNGVSVLSNLIASHQSSYISLYGIENYIPKFHMLIHVCEQIKNHGPLRHHWSMRFEGKNAVPKSKSHFNYKNIYKSLSHFYQISTTQAFWDGSGNPKLLDSK